MKAKRNFGSRRGNAMIEFALAAIVLTYSFTAVFQLGYSMYLYNELVSAVRAGARYASVAKLGNAADKSIPATYSDAIKNMVVYGNTSPAAGDQPVVPGLTTAQVSMSMTWGAAPANAPLDCTINISNYTIDAVFKTFTLTNKPSYKVPYMGTYCVINGSSC